MGKRSELALANDRTLERIGSYRPDVALLICELIAEGKTLTEIVKRDDTPSRATVYRWLTAFPEFHDAFERAKQISAQSFEEEALDMARVLKDKNDFTGTKVQAFNIAMQQLRWSASRRDAQRYGQKQALNVTVPVQINTSLNLGQDGKPATETQTSIYTLEATVPQVPDEPDDSPEESYDLDTETEVVDNGQVAFGVPAEQHSKLAAKRGRAPGWRKGHTKSPAAIARTIAAYERKAKNKEAKANGTSNRTDGADGDGSGS